MRVKHSLQSMRHIRFGCAKAFRVCWRVRNVFDVAARQRRKFAERRSRRTGIPGWNKRFDSKKRLSYTAFIGDPI